MDREQKRDLIAQWAFDTRPLLRRFHVWLEDVEFTWLHGDSSKGFDNFTFVADALRRCLAMTAGLTALGTKLFAPFGGGIGADKHTLNQVKKDADAVSAYIMSEGLWHFTRMLPENHAIMVCLGEGLMPKGGESPEMGANPQLGFGRVYARPEVARFVDSRVNRLLNDPDYDWDAFYAKMRDQGITIWGAAVDTLENTSRFAKGEEVGPLAVLHVFDQPLTVARPYETYMGTLAIPQAVAAAAEDHAIHVDLLAPRKKLVEAIELALPGIRREHIHVWTLGGKSREKRLGKLWEQWRELGVHIVENDWACPSGLPAFCDSGTYAPTYLVGSWKDARGATHLFLCDGYAASAEALQAASLSTVLDLDISMAVYSPKFELPMESEDRLMRLRHDDPKLEARLRPLFADGELTAEKVEYYRSCLLERLEANVPAGRRVVRADDFVPEKNWRVLAASGYMGQDPYSGLPGVEQVAEDTYKVTAQLATRKARVRVDFVFRLLEPFEQSRPVFSPLLERFAAGEDYRTRPVRTSDSGRIRNELQTICSQALEHDEGKIRLHFDRIDDDLMSSSKRDTIRKVLEWYKSHHPVWFSWLEIG
jgi:hypothetical protein